MRHVAGKSFPSFRWLAVGGALAAGAALTFVACGNSDDPAPTGAAGAAAGGAAGAGGQAGGGAGGARVCGKLTPPSTKASCAACLASRCCDEQIACTASVTCLGCNQAAHPEAAGAAGADGTAGAAGMGAAGAGTGGTGAAGMGGGAAGGAGKAGAAGAGASGAGGAGAGGAGAAGAAGTPGSSTSPAACSADPEASALESCLLNKCAADCELTLAVVDCAAPAVAASQGSCVNEKDPAILCNPLKHTGCTKDTTPDDTNKNKPPMPDVPSDLAKGYACDGNYGQDGKPSPGLICFGPPNTQTLCQECGDDLNKYCSDGFRCMQTVDGKICAAYCCNDGDCSASGRCDTSIISDISKGGFGVCVSK